MKRIKEDADNEETSHVYGLEELICQNVHITQRDLQIQCNPYQNPNYILHRSRKAILKFI
jgi:hypothetical protein